MNEGKTSILEERIDLLEALRQYGRQLQEGLINSRTFLTCTRCAFDRLEKIEGVIRDRWSYLSGPDPGTIISTPTVPLFGRFSKSEGRNEKWFDLYFREKDPEADKWLEFAAEKNLCRACGTPLGNGVSALFCAPCFGWRRTFPNTV